MGKTSLCLQMLELLNTGKKYQRSELADILETNIRNISEYKKELEEAGYYITTFKGGVGGYMLDKTHIFPTLKLTREEKDAIKLSYEYLLSKNDFLYKKNYQLAMGKIISSFSNDYEINPIKVVEAGQVAINDEKLESKYKEIESAIEKSKIITFDYLNNRNKIVNRIVEPYKLYIYNSNWFVHGYSRDLGDYRSFKLARMSNLKMENKKFSRDIWYKESDFFDQNGFKKNDEWYTIKLKISGYPLLKINEQRLGRNQKLERINNKEGILTVDMQYKINIYNFVTGLGVCAEVLEPEWLKNDIVKILNQMMAKYKTE